MSGESPSLRFDFHPKLTLRKSGPDKVDVDATSLEGRLFEGVDWVTDCLHAKSPTVLLHYPCALSLLWMLAGAHMRQPSIFSALAKGECHQVEIYHDEEGRLVIVPER